MKPLAWIFPALFAAAVGAASPAERSPSVAGPAAGTVDRPAEAADAVPSRRVARAERPSRPCLRYQQQVDEAKMQRIGTAAAQRGVGVVWVNPPTRRVCVAWA